ncbi:MAG: phosphate signaling complex protein PhoU [Planctomycetales bacterium]|nr:phosphate signaling complex protein PhoU [Planctomycetales bacterium]NIM08219.1 phosphate signaling complex protein PhoU [Planctomycetales bacterium]NIN07713.1 phosphate signaling complex protein PhoU [Planctomycetales bacterium]NIN76839.1 phosphate signaling complex protein PhoU [Planctomycetales bacterium]NIO34035.1 phosphate signaling complex protein PhoU [Planctomycetales bacterium]
MKKFDEELAELHRQLNEMALLANAMVQLTTSAVKDRRLKIQEELREKETSLDRMQMDIDHEAVRMLTVFGPVATALRDLLVVTHVTSQLERMGDQCLNVSDAIAMMSADPQTHPMPAKLQQMAELVCRIVDNALDAYFRKDAEKAKTTRTQDDLVDALNDQVMKELFTDDVLREVLAGARDIADAVAQVLIGRHLERIADQATNICKEVVFLVEGEDVRHRKLSS